MDNPRLPESESALYQRQLIEELVYNDDVYELAKQITDNGYFPVEALIAIDEGGKKIVVEGNRRLAALKLLLDPNKAPDKANIRKFSLLSKKIDADEIKKVKVTIAPSRDEADVFIANKHTPIQGTKKWKRLQQARFYKQRVDAGLTIAQIAKMFSVTEGDIITELRLLTMHSVACALELPDTIATKVKNTREFPATTLQRVYDNREVKKWLGIEFNNHQLQGSVKKDEFVKGYSKIITDISRGYITSRSHNKNDDFKKYLNEIDKYRPNHRSKGKFSCKDFEITEEDIQTNSSSASKSAKTATSKKRTKLIPRGYKCNVSNQRINEIFNELKKLKLVEHRNAIAVLFRCLLEMGLIHFISESGRAKAIVSHYTKKGQKRSRDWFPSLNQMLSYVSQHDTIISNRLNPVAIKAINKLASAQDSIYTTDFLHAFIHNLYIPPEADSLLIFWDQLQPIFDVVLNEPYDGE